MQSFKKIELIIQHLSQFVTPERFKRMQQVLDNRTNYICVALENVYQPHNASAVLRTCDCFGVQNIHIIENVNKYNVNPDIALGASNWLSIFKYNDTPNATKNCINQLKQLGYRVVATTPHKHDRALDELSMDNKIALLFGTETEGLTEEAINLADDYVRIPMYGFTESFNISVSASICLYHLTEKMRKSNIVWQLSPIEKQTILLDWLKNSINHADSIIEAFERKN